MDKVKIRISNGEMVEATAPVIISASRSTDIPAFYAKWFINRLRAGYCVWYNPFNQKPTYDKSCHHLCVYCYANTSKELVLKNRHKHNEDSESVIELG